MLFSEVALLLCRNDVLSAKSVDQKKTPCPERRCKYEPGRTSTLPKSGKVYRWWLRKCNRTRQERGSCLKGSNGMMSARKSHAPGVALRAPNRNHGKTMCISHLLHVNPTSTSRNIYVHPSRRSSLAQVRPQKRFSFSSQRHEKDNLRSHEASQKESAIRTKDFRMRSFLN